MPLSSANSSYINNLLNNSIQNKQQGKNSLRPEVSYSQPNSAFYYQPTQYKKPKNNIAKSILFGGLVVVAYLTGKKITGLNSQVEKLTQSNESLGQKLQSVIDDNKAMQNNMAGAVSAVLHRTEDLINNTYNMATSIGDKFSNVDSRISSSEKLLQSMQEKVENLTTAINKISSKTDKQAKDVDVIRQSLTMQVSELKDALVGLGNTLRVNNTASSKQLTNLSKKLNELEKLVQDNNLVNQTEFNGVLAQIRKMQSEIASVGTKVNGNVSKLQDTTNDVATTLNGINGKLDETIDSLSGIQTGVSGNKATLDSVRTNVSELRQGQKQLAAGVQGVKDKTKTLIDGQTTITSELQGIKTQNSEIQDKLITNIQNLRTKMQTGVDGINQKIDSNQGKITEQVEQLRQIISDGIAEIETRIANTENNISFDFDEILNQLDLIKNNFTGIQNGYSKSAVDFGQIVEDGKKEITKILGQISKDVASCKKQSAIMQTASDIKAEANKAEIMDNIQKIQDVVKQIIGEYSKKIDELNKSIGTVQNGNVTASQELTQVINTAQKQLEMLLSLIQDNQAKILSASSNNGVKVDTILTSTKGIQENVSNLGQQISGNDTKLDTILTSTKGIQENVSNLGQQISGMDDTFAGIQKDVAQVQMGVNKTNTDVGDFQKQMQALIQHNGIQENNNTQLLEQLKLIETRLAGIIESQKQGESELQENILVEVGKMLTDLNNAIGEQCALHDKHLIYIRETLNDIVNSGKTHVLSSDIIFNQSKAYNKTTGKIFTGVVERKLKDGSVLEMEYSQGALKRSVRRASSGELIFDKEYNDYYVKKDNRRYLERKVTVKDGSQKYKKYLYRTYLEPNTNKPIKKVGQIFEVDDTDKTHELITQKFKSTREQKSGNVEICNASNPNKSSIFRVGNDGKRENLYEGIIDYDVRERTCPTGGIQTFRTIKNKLKK